MTIPYLGVSKAPPNIPYSRMNPEVSLKDMFKEKSIGGKTVMEFIGADDFGAEWYERVNFEVDAGRTRVPLLYQPLYDEVIDPNLPEVQKVKSINNAGFIFEEIFEGGEVQFGHITTGEAAVSQRQFATGVEYDKKLVMFNQLWEIARVERGVGEAHNALLNHLHLYPILNHTYTGPNQTAAATTGATVAENWFLTVEDAIVNSQADTTNPRNGPYALLVHPARNFTLQRALTRVPQEGFQMDSNAAEFISTIIGYNGWTGVRGKKTVTYPGVALTKGYLVNLAYRGEDFLSLVKQPLESARGNPDISRFILDQIVWDIWLGIFANPARAVEEITWPV